MNRTINLFKEQTGCCNAHAVFNTRIENKQFGPVSFKRYNAASAIALALNNVSDA